MKRKNHTLNMNQINKQVAEINQRHLSARVSSSQISVQSVIKEALHFKSKLINPSKDPISPESKSKISDHLKNRIDKHYNNFNSFTKRNHELVVVLEFYKLINNCMSLETGMVASGHLVKRQKTINMIRRKQHRNPRHLPNIVKHRKYMYDHMKSLPSNISRHCGIHDGKHMRKFIYNMIGSGKLDYRTKKQLNKIGINNRLYIFKLTTHKRGIINVASKKDILRVIDRLLSFLHTVKNLD